MVWENEYFVWSDGMVMGRLVRLDELPNIGMFVGGYNDCNSGGNSW